MTKPISGALAIAAFLISMPAASANLSYTPDPSDFIVNVGVQPIAVLATGNSMTFNFVANGSLVFPPTELVKTLNLNTNHQIEYIELVYDRVVPVGRTAWRPVFDCVSGCGTATRAVLGMDEPIPTDATIFAGPSDVFNDPANYRAPRTNENMRISGSRTSVPVDAGYTNGAHTIYIHVRRGVGIDGAGNFVTAPNGAAYSFTFTAMVVPQL